MRGHSLVELTEHDDNVLLISSYIVCKAIHICTAAFIVHNSTIGRRVVRVLNLHRDIKM